MSTNILLCTLGVSWAVIPEAYALLAPEKLPLYRHHPERASLEQMRDEYRLVAPDEIWVCTTQGVRTTSGIDSLRQWLPLLVDPPILRLWQAEGTDELASHPECHLMRELIFRVSLLAAEKTQNGQLVLSLAGGRKTMSADLQEAGSLFGCRALVHVVGKESMPDELRKDPLPSLLAHALPETLCPHVLPLAIGSGRRSELLDVDFDDRGPVIAGVFPVPMPEHCVPCAWPGDGLWLCDETVRREQAGSRLLGNFLADLGKDELHENWRSLYRLPPAKITELQQTPLAQNHRDWLVALPKADLHRHLGGCLDLEAQIAVGRAVWENLTMAAKSAAIERVKSLLESKTDWDWDWPQRLAHPPELRAHAVAALLTQADPEQLRHQLYGVTEPRLALNDRKPHGFAYYERPGELTGSAILCHPAAVEPYARAIVQQAVDEGLTYVELRGSPQKYGDGLGFLQRLHAALAAATASLPPSPRTKFRFIVIADRKDRGSIAEVVDLAVKGKDVLDGFVAGLDLAGDEGTQSPCDLAPDFVPAFEACLPITIHAGETESANNIWQAAYHLHADRIGHGLSLSEYAELARRFRDRGICLELCPTSNREVVGFCDPLVKDSQSMRGYPLMDLWKRGIPLTVCTDNPGISRTTLADEYLAAARMTGSSLKQWDVLAMIKQGFAHAFLPADEREKLMKQADAAIYTWLTTPQ